MSRFNITHLLFRNLFFTFVLQFASPQSSSFNETKFSLYENFPTSVLDQKFQ